MANIDARQPGDMSWIPFVLGGPNPQTIQVRQPPNNEWQPFIIAPGGAPTIPYAFGVANALRQLDSAALGGATAVFTRENWQNCGGGPVMWFWDATVAQAEDDGGTVAWCGVAQVPGTLGGWRAQISVIYSQYFGVNPTSGADQGALIQAFFDCLVAPTKPSFGVLIGDLRTAQQLAIVDTTYKRCTLQFLPGSRIIWIGADGVAPVLDIRGVFQWIFENMIIFGGANQVTGNRARVCIWYRSNQSFGGHGSSGCVFRNCHVYWYGGTSATDEADGWLVGETPIMGATLQVDWTTWDGPCVCEGARDGANRPTARSGLKQLCGYNTGNFIFRKMMPYSSHHGLDLQDAAFGMMLLEGCGGGGLSRRAWALAEMPVMVFGGASWCHLQDFTVQQVEAARMYVGAAGVLLTRCEWQGVVPSDTVNARGQAVGWVVISRAIQADACFFSNPSYNANNPIPALNLMGDVGYDQTAEPSQARTSGCYFQMLREGEWAPIYCQNNSCCGTDSWWVQNVGPVAVVSKGDYTSDFLGPGLTNLAQIHLPEYDGSTPATGVRVDVAYGGNAALGAGAVDEVTVDFGVGYADVPKFAIQIADDPRCYSSDAGVRLIPGLELGARFGSPYGSLIARVKNTTAGVVAVPATTLTVEVGPRLTGPKFLKAGPAEAALWNDIKATLMFYWRPDWGAHFVTPTSIDAMADLAALHSITCPNQMTRTLDAHHVPFLEATVAQYIEIAAGGGWGAVDSFTFAMSFYLTAAAANPTRLWEASPGANPFWLWIAGGDLRYDYAGAIPGVEHIVTPTVGEWHCLELQMNAAGPTGDVWFDGIHVLVGGAYASTPITGLLSMLKGFGTACYLGHCWLASSLNATLPAKDWAFFQEWRHLP
jgi:hypothetical protein